MFSGTSGIIVIIVLYFKLFFLKQKIKASYQNRSRFSLQSFLRQKRISTAIGAKRTFIFSFNDFLWVFKQKLNHQTLALRFPDHKNEKRLIYKINAEILSLKFGTLFFLFRIRIFNL